MAIPSINFGGLFAQSFSTGGTSFPTFPIIHMGDQTAASGFGHSQGFSEQVVATVLAEEAVIGQFENFYEPLSRSLGMVMIPSFAANFAEGGRPPWEPLSLNTLEYRSALPILISTGTLLNAVTSPDSYLVTHADVSVNEAMMPHYAGYHQQGTRYMPQREFMKFQPEDPDLIEAIFAMWVEEVIGKWWAD